MATTRHIAVAGNMGVGKSTLTAALADRIGARAYYETVADNPWLERFYSDMRRWSFHSQFCFLSQAFHQHCDIMGRSELCVQDRTVYEHFHVFATSHYDQGLLSDEEFAMLGEHFRALTQVVPGPDLMIYLRASVPTLVSRIRGRDRSCESNVEVAYLLGLERRYERWMESYDASDVLVIDTDDIDIHDPAQREGLLSLLESRITGAPQVASVAGPSGGAPWESARRRARAAGAVAGAGAAAAAVLTPA